MRVNFPSGKISGFSFATFPKIKMSLTSRWRPQKDFMDKIGSYVNVQKKERGRHMKVGFCIWFSKNYLIQISVCLFFVPLFSHGFVIEKWCLPY